MFPTSREGHRSAIERRNLGGHSISFGRPLRVLWHRRDLLWIPQPPAKYVHGEVLGSRVCCVGGEDPILWEKGWVVKSQTPPTDKNASSKEHSRSKCTKDKG
ncbi:hypothetical protein AVEN_242300-1 [Araneus ventricosus]|uniref:Uncharacterized protein n=1 Tax=Araneus ventricosus TaxID=182803 RepID=A0A4Y2U474_ARAVE|nr:hypothetical protein AVEN_242300-1 [Araneus ventricosus]